MLATTAQARQTYARDAKGLFDNPALMLLSATTHCAKRRPWQFLWDAVGQRVVSLAWAVGSVMALELLDGPSQFGKGDPAPAA